MLISLIMKKLWSELSITYQQEYEAALKMDELNLYYDIIDSIERSSELFNFYNSDDFSATMLASTGCCYQKRNGYFEGCSMCDYYSQNIPELAKINALKDRNIERYKDAVEYSLISSRGKYIRPSTVEVLTTYNIFDNDAFPEDMFGRLFKRNDCYIYKPLVFKFESRASMINSQTLNRVKKYFGNRAFVSIGVETSNEWLRNHWLNKDITNTEIKKAVEAIHSLGWSAVGNLIIGIPGLTENASVQLSHQSIEWMNEIGFDTIVCSPLVRKPCTLQSFLYTHLRNNPVLMSHGLVQGEHTGMPSIYTVINSIYPYLLPTKKIRSKIELSLFHFPLYQSYLQNYYQAQECAWKFENIIKVLFNFANTKSDDDKSIIDAFMKDTISPYEETVTKQKEIKDSRASLYYTAQEVSAILWPGTWKNKLSGFANELQHIII